MHAYCYVHGKVAFTQGYHNSQLWQSCQATIMSIHSQLVSSTVKHKCTDNYHALPA